jgi:hypothetical protein
MKLKTTKMITLSTEETDQSFITDELLHVIPGNRDILCPPGVLLYYLMFISYHRLNDISRHQDCLHDLMLYVTTESTKFSTLYQYLSFIYLKQAFTIISDTEGVYNCNIMLNTLLETTDLKKLMGQE